MLGRPAASSGYGRCFWTGTAVLAATWLGGRFQGTREWLLLAGLPALAWYAHRIAKA